MSFGGKEKHIGQNRFYDHNWAIKLLYSGHLAEDIDDIKPGDIIILHRGVYLHFALVTYVNTHMSQVTVIDFHELEDGLKSGIIGKRTFNLSDEIWVLEVPEKDSYPVEEVIRRAESRVGEEDYHVALNNCEHFAMWCKTGEHWSRQVLAATTTGLTLGAFVLVGAYSLAKTLLTSKRREDKDYA